MVRNINPMSNVRHIVTRLLNSSVAWYWGFNGLRLASGIVLLPLLLRLLPENDLGMYYVFLSITAMGPVVDFGFSQAIGRFVSYAMGGATELKAFGVATGEPRNNAGPNYRLIWELLHTTRTLYRYLCLAALVLLGVWGSYLVGLKVHESASPAVTWWAWAITLLGLTFEIYAGWWNSFLLCMNRVTTSARIGVLAYGVRLLISCVLLVMGCGLLSVPIASFAGSLLNRGLCRRRCLRLLGPPPAAQALSARSLLGILWPNSWRLGVHLLGGYLRSGANTAICVAAFGLAATAEYGLSIQVMQIATAMAAVWTFVKWPLVGQLRARQDFEALRRVLWRPYWLQTLTFLALGLVTILWGPTFLRLIGSNKMLLTTNWMVMIGVAAFLEMQFTFWATVITTENRLPYLWPTLATNVCSLLLSLVLVYVAGLGVGGLILGPLLTGIVFNYWFWPLEGAKGIKTGLLQFLFAPGRGPVHTQ